MPDAKHDWISGLDATGLLVSEPVLQDHFPDGPPPVGESLRRRATTEWERFQLRPDGQAQWLDVVLEELTGIGRASWRRHPEIPEQTTHALAEYRQTLRPSRVLVDDAGDPLLLVWTAPAGHDLDRRETESGTWRASPSTKLERLMREVDVPLGLATNGRQFRLMFAGEGVTPHITWTATDWMDDPQSLDAFAMLLGRERFFGDEAARLLALVEESQQRQLAVTDQLGDQVRAALDQFVRAIGHADQAAEGAVLAGMPFEAIYEMALVFMMRLVFLLYGEENTLLPHGEMLYDRSYGITHLWTRLSQEHRDDAPAMRRRFDAFPQLLATFRLIHEGCEHPDLALLGYGGKLFDPARFPALEDRRMRVPNATMHAILHQLIFARGKVGRTTINQRLSYRELDVEQLGSVYEGLIDGMVKRAEETMVTIASGDEPVVPLRELEAREGDDLAEYLRSVSSMSSSRASSAAEGAEEPLPLDEIEGAEACDADLLQRIAPYASFLDVGATVLPGDLYMVQQSGARKAGGQYYTPKWITRFICERTLEPLVYDGEGPERRIKSPAEILALNVCDPAMGSGAFLVQACRYLAERLVESWDACVERTGGQVTLPLGEPASEAGAQARVLPEDHDEAVTWAMRYVADNCLYGVDVNHLAVELAKMSLWLATLSQDRPFTFLDHKLKCGNSIIGAWAEDIDRYPAAAWDRKAETGSALSETLKEVRKTVREQMKQAERAARGGQQTFSAQVPDVREQASQAMLSIERIDTMDPGRKEREYHRLLEENEGWQSTKRMYDAWCALWFWPLVQDIGGAERRAIRPEDVPLVWGWQELMHDIAPDESAQVLNVVSNVLIADWATVVECLHREHRFFHWELEFPDVFVERDGFDAFVFNPPYVDCDLPRVSTARRLGECGNLFAYFIDLADMCVNAEGGFGCIVPMSAISTDRMDALQRLLVRSQRRALVANFAWRPAKVFDEVNIPVSVIVAQPGPSRVLTTTYMKWHSGEQRQLMSSLEFADSSDFVLPGSIPKIGSPVEADILRKVFQHRSSLSELLQDDGDLANRIFIKTAGGLYFKVALTFEPLYAKNGKQQRSSTTKELFVDGYPAEAVVALMNSHLFYWFFMTYSDCYHLTQAHLERFPFDPARVDANTTGELAEMGARLMEDVQANSEITTRRYSHGEAKLQQIFMRRSRPLLDEVTRTVGAAYDLSDSEIEFLIDYDAAFRWDSE